MRRLVSFYGDDFTGSTDVMEALSLHGVKTVLFTRPPSDNEIETFAGYDAVGIAGASRSQTPGWMDAHLPAVFECLRRLDARFCHYKVCSTFDSSPAIGSIGRAIEIGRHVFRQRTIPLVVGVPQLKRYTAFGHLFANYQGEVYRIDKHPVMSHHPVTPMDESDLRIHLRRQTTLPVGLVPVNLLASGNDAAMDAAMAADGIVLLDVLDDATQLETGRLLLRFADRLGPFVAGSSGIEYALLRALAEQGALTGRVDVEPLGAVERIVVVSGSCSPTTARQIRFALSQGFEGLHADPVALAGECRGAMIRDITGRCVELFRRGRSVIVYTALDPGSDRAAALGTDPGVRQRVGESLGLILREAIAAAGLSRAVIAGGDTSGHALGQLDVHALTLRFPLTATPGSPLCRAWSADSRLEGLELAMKGGQVGGDDYFVALQRGLSPV